jgi:hypothetical protein
LAPEDEEDLEETLVPLLEPELRGALMDLGAAPRDEEERETDDPLEEDGALLVPMDLDPEETDLEGIVTEPEREGRTVRKEDPDVRGFEGAALCGLRLRERMAFPAVPEEAFAFEEDKARGA